MSTNLTEFKKRLGADPHEQEPESRLDRPEGPEFDEARREVGAFEEKLAASLEIVPPSGLLPGLLEIPARLAQPRRRWLAIAASVVVVAGAAGLLWNSTEPTLTLDEHVAWHFSLDGQRVLDRATADFDLQTSRDILAQFDFQADAEMESHIMFIKICPGYEGDSAHMVVQTGDGPVSIFIMPGVSTDEHLVEFDGMQAYLVTLNGATAAIVGRNEQSVAAYRDMVRNALTRLS